MAFWPNLKQTAVTSTIAVSKVHTVWNGQLLIWHDRPIIAAINHATFVHMHQTHDALIEKRLGLFSQETSALWEGMGADGGWKGEGGRKEDQSVWRWILHWPLCCPSVTAIPLAPSASLPLPGHKNRVCVVYTLLKLQSHTFYHNNKIYIYKYITSFI